MIPNGNTSYSVYSSVLDPALLLINKKFHFLLLKWQRNSLNPQLDYLKTKQNKKLIQ